MKLTWLLEDTSQTQLAGEALSQVLESGDFIGLSGPLGAGKTCLTRGLMAGLWGDDTSADRRVTSPTYTLMNQYTAAAPFTRILHADLYRLEDMDDLASTGYWDAIEEVELTLVEWIDKLPQAWPAQGLEVTLAYKNTQRLLSISWRGDSERGTARLTAIKNIVDTTLGR